LGSLLRQLQDKSPNDFRALIAIPQLGRRKAYYLVAKNTVSRLKLALAEVGIAVDRRRDMPVDPNWAALLATLADRKRVELRKFAGWCSARRIAPAAVQQQTFADYFAFLAEQSIQHNLKERWRRAWRVWNEEVVVEGSGYPRIDSIFHDRDRLISLSELPPQIACELKTYKETLTRPTLFGGGSPGAATKGALAGRLRVAVASRCGRPRRMAMRPTSSCSPAISRATAWSQNISTRSPSSSIPTSSGAA
jgi:hypothetical protein